MKKIHLLGLLAFAIVAGGVMLSQSTSANNLTLSITAAAGAGCTGTGSDTNAGTSTTSYSDKAYTGDAGTFICTGTSATSSTLQMGCPSVNGPQATSFTDIKGYVTTLSLIGGDAACIDTVAATGAYTTMTSAINVLNRNDQGRPCTLQAANVKIQVIATANAPVWAYTGTLTFTASGW